MQITIVGAGYVGLVTAVSLAASGHSVHVVERSSTRLADLQAGRVPFSEPGLDELLALHRSAMVFDHGLSDGPGDLVFIAVGTPIDNGDSDLSQLRAAADLLRPWPEAHVSIRSTLPPGTSPRLPAILGRPDGRNLSTNPEFLRQGAALQDFQAPSRIVIGRFDETCDDHLGLIEAAYARISAPRLIVDVASAELIKNAANAFLALKLSFVNELASLTEEYKADIEDVLAGIGLDPRIGTAYMKPGLGFGGSCLPKELQVLAVAGRKKGLAMHVARAASTVNAEQQERFARSIINALGRTAGRVGVLGLSFKAGTDDLRGSPALTIARRLAEAGHRVVAHDPEASPNAALDQVPEIEVVQVVEEVFREADAVVIATEWPLYAELPWIELLRLMRGNLLFDGRNLLDPDSARAAGYAYRGIGRGQPLR